MSPMTVKSSNILFFESFMISMLFFQSQASNMVTDMLGDSEEKTRFVLISPILKGKKRSSSWGELLTSN